MAIDMHGDVNGQLQQMFPNEYNSFKGIPELWDLMVWGAAKGWDPTLLEAAMQNSNYYKTHTDAQRQWDIKMATDPASAQNAIQQWTRQVSMDAARYGAQLNMSQIHQIAVDAATNGYTQNELQDRIVLYTTGEASAHHGDNAPGAFGAAMTKVRQIADEYAMPVSSKEVILQAQNMLLSGSGADESSLRDIFAKRAESLFPSLAPELQKGMTVKQWATPYTTLAAQQLEISPDSINLSDPKWRPMLDGTKDPKTGVRSPMTLAEWEATIRQNKTYGYDTTTGAKDQAAQLEAGLAQKFGAAG